MNLRRIAVATLAGLLLSACSDDPPDPEATPTPTASSSPTPTESTEPSTVTDGRSLVAEWVAAYNSVIAGGDSNEFDSLSQDCKTCRDLGNRFADIYEAGGSISGGNLTLKGARRVQRESTQEAWLAAVVVAPASYTESADGAEKSLSGGASTYRFLMDRSGESLVIGELFVESS